MRAPQINVTPLKSYHDGTLLSGCFVVHDPVASKLATQAAMEFKEVNHTGYIVRPHSVRPELARIYMAMMVSNAKNTARYMLQNGQLHSRDGNVPIVYPPDGGIAASYGMEEGIGCFSTLAPTVFRAAGRDDIIPPEALRAAAESGVLILCDDAINGGVSMTNLLNSARDLPDDVHIIIYSSHALGNAPDTVFRADNLKKLTHANGKPFNLSIFVSSIHNLDHKTDLLETGDVIANVHGPLTDRLKERLSKRKPHERS